MSTFSVHSFSIGFVPKLSQVFLYRTISHFSPLHFYGTLKFHWICSKIAHVFLYRMISHFSPLLWHTQISIGFVQKCHKYFSVGRLKFLHHFFLQVLRTSAVENATTGKGGFNNFELIACFDSCSIQDSIKLFNGYLKFELLSRIDNIFHARPVQYHTSPLQTTLHQCPVCDNPPPAAVQWLWSGSRLW